MRTYNVMDTNNENIFLEKITALALEQFEQQGVSDKFTYEISTLQEKEIKENVCGNRMDLRDLVAFTIDCADTKDMDDAVSLSYDQDTKRYHLGVHIADVSAYITPGTKLDAIAMERGTSIYLPNLTVPMLPPVLSNNLCSLNPNVDRNSISILMDLDENGTLLSSTLSKSKIRSRIKGSYEEINRLLSEEEIPLDIQETYRDVEEDVRRMNKLAKRLREARRKQGANLENQEAAKVRLVNGQVILEPCVAGAAENMIEEFMVLANSVVATYFKNNQLPAIYRTQDVKNSLARYQTKESHHAELALENYAHFTSPIRRLADLRMHQILSMHLAGCSTEVLHYVFDQLLEESCEYANKRSRRADGIEKFINRKCYMEYFKNHVFERYQGTVKGFNRHGKPIVTLDKYNVNAIALNTSGLRMNDKVSLNILVEENTIKACNYQVA